MDQILIAGILVAKQFSISFFCCDHKFVSKKKENLFSIATKFHWTVKVNDKFYFWIVQTSLKSSREHETAPKTRSSAGCWAPTMRIGSIFHVCNGNLYQFNVPMILSISSNALLNFWPNSQQTNTIANDENICWHRCSSTELLAPRC